MKASSKKEAKCELWVKIICFTPEMKSSHCEAPPDAGGSASQEELERVHKYPQGSVAGAVVRAPPNRRVFAEEESLQP